MKRFKNFEELKQAIIPILESRKDLQPVYNLIWTGLETNYDKVCPSKPMVNGKDNNKFEFFHDYSFGAIILPKMEDDDSTEYAFQIEYEIGSYLTLDVRYRKISRRYETHIAATHERIDE
jgi:hypothetical protein